MSICVLQDALSPLTLIWPRVPRPEMNKFQEGLQAQRKLVEQLRSEAAIQRLPVSECVAEMIKYCDQYQDGDVLIKGFAKQNDNPFKEKGSCTIL